VRLNSANRSFFALVATALVPYGLLSLFGCGLLSVVAFRIAADGVGGLTRDGQDLRPAVVFFAVVAVGTAIGAQSVRRQLAATQALAVDVAARTVPPTVSMEEAVSRAGLAGRVDVVDDVQPYSFTYGLSRPRVAISTGLIDAVGGEELEAVLHHERYHVRNADTLKVVVARAAPSALFFLPALGVWRHRYLTGRELAADRAAVRASSERALTGALFKALDGPTWGDLGTAAALGGGVLDQRVEQLEDGTEPPLPRVPRRAAWLTVAGLGALAGLFALTIALAGADVLAMDGSMPTGGMATAMTVLGSVACTAAMATAVVVALRGGTGHRRAD
jgi:hypothetical protein